MIRLLPNQTSPSHLVLYENPMSFLMSQNHVRVFFLLLSFSQGGGLSVLEMLFFQLSVDVKVSLAESQQMSCLSFMFLSRCFYVPFMLISCCIHFPSCSFHCVLCSFHVPFMISSLGIHILSFSVAMYQTYRSSKGAIVHV